MWGVFGFQIYPSLPKYTPFSASICDPPGIYPPRIYHPVKHLFMRHSLPGYTTICDPPRISPSIREYTPLLSTSICDSPGIYPSFPEPPPPPFHYHMRHPHNLPLPLIIYPSFLQLYVTLQESTPPSRIYYFQRSMCHPHRIYPSLRESNPPSQIVPPFLQLYAILP